MALIINKVSSASLQVNYSYLGSDLLFGYETVGTYKIDFADITYTNEENILFEGIEALRQAYQQKNLVASIGGDSYTNGRLTSQTFEESSLVGNGSCSVTIEESKRLDDYSGNEFAENIPSPQWIESFSETFSFSRSGDTYSSSRNVSLKYKQDAGSQFLNNAKVFLTDIYFNFRPNLGYHVDGISENGRFNGGFRPLVTETIDLLGLSVSIQENLETSFIDGDHSKRQTYSLEVDESGYLSKKYTVEIKAIKEPLEAVADAACIAITDALIAENNANFGIPIEIGKGINKDGGMITLNISFTNNPLLNKFNTVTYSVTKSMRNIFYDYALNIEFASEGKNQIEKDANVNAYWASTIPTYKTKVQSLFAEATLIYEQSRSTAFQVKDAKISDSVVYTTDTSYNVILPILKFKSSSSTSAKVDRIRLFVDITDKKEKMEVSGLTTLGNGSITLEAVASRSAGFFAAANFLDSQITPIEYTNSDVVTINSEGATSRVINYEFT